MKLTIKIKPGQSQERLLLGRQYENAAMEIAFDCSELAEEFGPGTAVLFAKRPKSQDVYVVANAIQADNVLTWTVSSYDTMIPGSGAAELRWTTEDSKVSSRPRLFTTVVLNGLGEATRDGVEAGGSGLSSADAAKFVSDASTADSLAAAAKDATEIRPFAFMGCSELTTADFPKATKIGEYAFSIPMGLFNKTSEDGDISCSNLKTANFPMVTEIGEGAFNLCAGLAEMNFPSATEIGAGAFAECNSLTEVSLPAAITIGASAICGCTRLTKVSLPAATEIKVCALCDNHSLTEVSLNAVATIGEQAFYNCTSMVALILRNSAEVCTLTDTGAFLRTPIESGTGYIYVPSALLSSYRAATNWSTYANQFRALEDYTVDGTTTGALDSSKI